MASPINSPSSRDIWHLTLDDLLAPLPEKPRLGGDGPFVINLSSSTSQISPPAKLKSDHPSKHVFQIMRIEDGRLRYRLRLGPFRTEDEADAVLESVRDSYPVALTATAGIDDLAELANLLKPAKPPTRPPNPPEERRAETITAAAPRVASIPEAARPAAVPQSPAQPPPHASPAEEVVRASAVNLARSDDTIESTQTVRPLTLPELEADESSRWFVIQLSLAQEPFDPDTVPNLDIFGVYRLYCVAGFDDGRLMHALRLGFFSEESAAQAVASYLAAYYDKPTVKRVSVAERERFAERTVDARKDVGASGQHAVIEITNELVVRDRRSDRTPVRAPAQGPNK